PPRSTLVPYTTLFRSFRQRVHADAAHHVRRGARADGALGVAHGEVEPLLLAALEEGGRGGDELVIERRRRFVAAELGAIARIGADRKSTRLNSSHVKI